MFNFKMKIFTAKNWHWISDLELQEKKVRDWINNVFFLWTKKRFNKWYLYRDEIIQVYKKKQNQMLFNAWNMQWSIYTWFWTNQWIDQNLVWVIYHESFKNNWMFTVACRPWYFTNTTSWRCLLNILVNQFYVSQIYKSTKWNDCVDIYASEYQKQVLQWNRY